MLVLPSFFVALTTVGSTSMSDYCFSSMVLWTLKSLLVVSSAEFLTYLASFPSSALPHMLNGSRGLDFGSIIFAVRECSHFG